MKTTTPKNGKSAAAADTEQAEIDGIDLNAPVIKARHIAPSILNDLQDYLDLTQTTQAKLAVKMGVSPTYISKAFKGAFNGDVASFEAAALNFLESVKKKRVDNTEICETGFLVEPMANFLDTVKHTGDIGVGYNPAGKGKSMGIQVYLKHNPLAVLVTVTKSFSGWRSVRDAILEQVGNKRLSNSESWDTFLRRTFRGSGRLLILDNAHLLTRMAITWVAYDWHEATGCPVALIGNPQIVHQWKADDQLFSRVGLARNIKPHDNTKASDTAKAMLKLFVPDVPQDDAKLVKAAVDVLKGRGAIRALRKHLLLMRELLRGNPNYAPAGAFYAAHTQLLTEVKLEEEKAAA